jgi:hypothetical protein
LLTTKVLRNHESSLEQGQVNGCGTYLRYWDLTLHQNRVWERTLLAAGNDGAILLEKIVGLCHDRLTLRGADHLNIHFRLP